MCAAAVNGCNRRLRGFGVILEALIAHCIYVHRVDSYGTLLRGGNSKSITVNETHNPISELLCNHVTEHALEFQVAKVSCIQCRHVLVILAFCGLWNVYTMRVNLGVAIVAMVASTRTAKNVSQDGTCPHEEPVNVTRHKKGEFEWSEYTQGILLGAFFYVYIITNFLGGRIAEIFGVKWTFGIGILSTSILTLLTPVIARWSYVALIVLRIVEGTMEGVTFPAIHCMTGRWFGKKERGSAYTIMFSGSTVGSVIGLILSGVLCHSDFLGGWPSVFYVFGFIGLIWCVFWFTLMYENPEDHPRISAEELDHIQQGKEDDVVSKEMNVPWLSILKSVPVWVVAFAAFGRNWIHNVTLFTVPTYLKNVLHYDIAQSGFLSSLPSIVEAIITIAAGYISDWFLAKGILGVNATRKVLNTLGLVLSAICFVVIPFVGCDREAIVTLLTISTGISGLCIAGFMVSIVDMSPTFAGTLMGVTNAFGQVSGILAPYTVGSLTDNNQTSAQWHIIFYITTAISAVTAFLFAAFGSAKLQDWSKEKTTTTKEDPIGSHQISNKNNKNHVTTISGNATSENIFENGVTLTSVRPLY